MSEPHKLDPRGRGTFYTSTDTYVLARANNGLELVIEGISTLSQYSECNMRDLGRLKQPQPIRKPYCGEPGNACGWFGAA